MSLSLLDCYLYFKMIFYWLCLKGIFNVIIYNNVLIY